MGCVRNSKVERLATPCLRAAQFKNVTKLSFLRQCKREIAVNRRVVHLKAPKRVEKREFPNTLPKMERRDNRWNSWKRKHISLFSRNSNVMIFAAGSKILAI